MVNVLLDSIDFHLPYAQTALEKIIAPPSRVLIIPYAFKAGSVHDEENVASHADWLARYGAAGRYTRGLVNPFLAYGIPQENIQFLDYFADDEAVSQQKVRQSDILFFNGGYEDKLLERLDERNIRFAVESHRGVMMGWSAGALIQCENYFVSPDEDAADYVRQSGLHGFIADFAVEVHYTGALAQRESIARYRRETGNDVYTLQPESAIVVQDGTLQLLGHAARYGGDAPSPAV